MTTRLMEWFSERQKALAIDVKEVGISDVHDWKIIEENGAPHHIGRADGRFHQGVALQAWDQGQKAWVERFLIKPIPADDDQELYGIALLAKYTDKYLVQAKAEPGNATPGHVQLTTTIQASYTNIKGEFSGKIAFTNLYDDPRTRQYVVSQDGAQLYMKKNAVCFIELDKEPGSIGQNFVWATLHEIKALARDGLVSEHVFQCLGAELMQ